MTPKLFELLAVHCNGRQPLKLPSKLPTFLPPKLPSDLPMFLATGTDRAHLSFALFLVMICWILLWPRSDAERERLRQMFYSIPPGPRGPVVAGLCCSLRANSLSGVATGASEAETPAAGAAPAANQAVKAAV